MNTERGSKRRTSGGVGFRNQILAFSDQPLEISFQQRTPFQSSDQIIEKRDSSLPLGAQDDIRREYGSMGACDKGARVQGRLEVWDKESAKADLLLVNGVHL